MVRAPLERPELEVEGLWLTPESADELGTPLFDVSGLDPYGKRMYLGDDQLVWTRTQRDKHLQLRFRRRGDVPCFDVVYQYLPSAKKLAGEPDFEGRKQIELLRYLVLFPLAWHLRRTRGWELIHAAAASDGERGIVLAGPSGAGKSTTCVALMEHAGMGFLTENLALTDGASIYPISEPIRLTDESMDLVGEAVERLQPVGGNGLQSKSMFVPPEVGPGGVRAAALFLVRVAERAFVQRLSPLVAYRTMQATNVLSLMLDDFAWYTAALDLLWPQPGSTDRQSILHLTREVPCYVLGIDRSAGTVPVVEAILGCLRDQTPPLPGTSEG